MPGKVDNLMDDSVNTTNNKETNNQPATIIDIDDKQAKPRSYSEDYVKDLRQENKEYRLRAKSREQALKRVLGLSETDSLDENLDARITQFLNEAEQKLKEANSKVNTYLINRAIADECKDVYDEKLMHKIIDLSCVSVDESGKVTGIKEAIANAEKEFPAVKKQQVAKYSDDTGNSSINNPGESDAIKAFKKYITFKDEK